MWEEKVMRETLLLITIIMKRIARREEKNFNSTISFHRHSFVSQVDRLTSLVWTRLTLTLSHD